MPIGAWGGAPPQFKRHHSVKFDVFGKNICICRCPLSTFDSLFCTQFLVCHSLTNTLNSFNLYLCLHFVSFGDSRVRVEPSRSKMMNCTYHLTVMFD